MTQHPTLDPQVSQRLRETLRAVADTVTDETHPAAVPSAVRPARSRRSRRRLGVAAGAVAIPFAMAAAVLVHSGPEYVDSIPADTIITRGTVDGDSYLLVESRRTECGQPVRGVELVEEDENLLGSEWNTMGTEYGEPRLEGCGFDTRRYLTDPALFNDGGTVVGDSFVWTWAVHPDVTAVRITAEGFTKDLPVYTVDGAGYALFEVPRGLDRYTAELLIDGSVVPGSVEVHAVPAR